MNHNIKNTHQQDNHRFLERILRPYLTCPNFLGASELTETESWCWFKPMDCEKLIGQPDYYLVDSRRNEIAQFLLIGQIEEAAVGPYGQSAYVDSSLQSDQFNPSRTISNLFRLEKSNYRVTLNSEWPDTVDRASCLNPYFAEYKRNLEIFRVELVEQLDPRGPSLESRQSAGTTNMRTDPNDSVLSPVSGPFEFLDFPPTPPRNQMKRKLDTQSSVLPLTLLSPKTLTMTKRVAYYVPQIPSMSGNPIAPNELELTPRESSFIGPPTAYDPCRYFLPMENINQPTSRFRINEFHLYDENWNRLLPGISDESGRDLGALYPGDLVECNVSLVAYRIPGQLSGSIGVQNYRIKIRINCVRVLKRASVRPTLQLSPEKFLRISP